MGFLFFLTLIGLIPAAIAQSKGRNFAAWWLYGALLFIVALPHALMLKKDQQVLDRDALQSGQVRKCPACAELVRREAIKCRFCGELFPALEAVAVPTGMESVITPSEGQAAQDDNDLVVSLIAVGAIVLAIVLAYGLSRL